MQCCHLSKRDCSNSLALVGSDYTQCGKPRMPSYYISINTQTVRVFYITNDSKVIYYCVTQILHSNLYYKGI